MRKYLRPYPTVPSTICSFSCFYKKVRPYKQSNCWALDVLHEHFDFKSFGRSIIIFCKLWTSDVSSSVSGPGYIEVSVVFRCFVSQVQSRSPTPETDTLCRDANGAWDKFMAHSECCKKFSGKAAPGFVCNGISNRFGSTNCSLRKQI